MVGWLRFVAREGDKKRPANASYGIFHRLMTRSLIKVPVMFLLALVFLVPTVLARDLYVGEAVLGDDQRVDEQVLLRALDEVLVRLTGQVEESPAKALGVSGGQVNNLIQTRHTVRRERLDEDGQTDSELRVRVEFDEMAVNQLLRENRLPRWGRERPAILLWVALEDEGGVDFADDPWLKSVVSEQARRLGLEIVYPLRDALDMAEITLADIRGGFLDSATAAAQRYGTGVIAMLDLRRESVTGDPSWSARWFWRIGGADAGLQHTGIYRELLVRRGMERLAANMAGRFAIQDMGGESGARRLLVDGVVDDVHFAEVRRYLTNLGVVEDVRIVAARDRSLEFELEVSGEGLEQFLEMGDVLVPAGPAVGETLHYRLRR